MKDAQPMKIGLIIYGSLDIVSGGFLYDRKLVEHLTAQGHTVDVLTLPWQNYLTHLRDNFSTDLAQTLYTAEYDILLQDELNHPSLVWLNRQLKRQVSYPIISIVHHLRSREPRAAWLNALYRQIEKQYLRDVDGFIFNSQTTQKTVADLRDDMPPSVVAYPAADRFGEQQPRPLPQVTDPLPPFRLLFVGSVTPRKGLHILLKALGRLRDVAWHLDVVGSLEVDLSYALAMQKFTVMSQWEERVKFWHVVPDEELAVRYRTADLLVVPSAYEGFGIVYLEAMSFGVPAVGTTGGAAHEVLDHGREGFLIQPNDDQHLADIISELHQNRHLLAEMSQNARARYETQPTWADTTHTIEQFLRQFVVTQ